MRMLSERVVATRHSPGNLAHALLSLFIAAIISLSVDCMRYVTVVHKERRDKCRLILDGVKLSFELQYSLYATSVNLTDGVDIKERETAKSLLDFRLFFFNCAVSLGFL